MLGLLCDECHLAHSDKYYSTAAVSIYITSLMFQVLAFYYSYSSVQLALVLQFYSIKHIGQLSLPSLQGW